MVSSVSDLTHDHLITSIQWISKMSGADRWNLTDIEVAAFLEVPLVTYHDMLDRAAKGVPFKMAEATVERLSLLLSIWKGLKLLVPAGRQDLALQWFNTANSSPTFKNLTIKHYLLENNTLEGFRTVRDYLHANR